MSVPVTIRPATEPELDRIARIWDESWHSTGIPSPEVLSHSQLRDRLVEFIRSGADLYVIEHDQDVAGMMVLDPISSKLSQLFLTPTFQRRGLGTACLAFAKTALPGGFTLMVAEANRAAQEFYAAAGLAQEARIFRAEYKRHDLRFRWAPESAKKNPAP